MAKVVGRIEKALLITRQTPWRIQYILLVCFAITGTDLSGLGGAFLPTAKLPMAVISSVDVLRSIDEQATA